MPAVFVIRDPETGATVISPADRITRIVGRVTVTVAPGSFDIPLEDGTPFFFLPTTPDVDGLRVPPITQNGRNLSWPSLATMGQYANPNQVNFDIVYGYY